MTLHYRLLVAFATCVAALLLAAVNSDVQAQGPAAKKVGKKAPAAPVVTSAVQSHRLSSSIHLPGSVDSIRKTQVAAPVAGLVVDVLVRDGDSVEQDQILARLDTSTLEARRATLEAQLQEAQARLRGAEVKVRRAEELFDAGVIPAEQLDDSRFEFEALDARSTALKAQIAELDLNIEQSTIRAPFGGGVSAKLTEVGQWARVGDPLLEIVATDELEINVAVPEVHLSKVRLNQIGEATFEALPGLKLRGAVHALSPQADPNARTFPVKLAVPARNGRVRPGMVAEVTFAPSRPRDVLIAPKDALVERDTGWTVFVAQPDQTVKEVPVRLGESVDAWTEVSGEVSAGDQVVILGNERLRNGQSVNPQVRDLPQP